MSTPDEAASVLRHASGAASPGPLLNDGAAVPVAVPAPDAPDWLAIRRLAAQPDLGGADVDAFLGRHASPIIEGPYATFLWRGEADRVLLRHAVIQLPNPLPLARAGETDLWSATVALPWGARVEYQLECVSGGAFQGRFNDPRNSWLGWGPFGAQSVCGATGYVDPDWAHPDPEVEPGSLVELPVPSRSLGRAVRVQVYLPRGFRPRGHYPLLVVHDGSDFLQYAAGVTILDNLIHRGEVAPLVAAFVSAGPRRLTEYADDPRHAVFLVRELLPALVRRFRFLPGAGERTLMGSSFGGIASLSTAVRFPGRFGSLLLESASLVSSEGGGAARGGSTFAPVVRFVDSYRRHPRPVVRRMFLTCGAFEPLIGPNRAIEPIFRDAGIDVRYREAPDGHQWVNWRDRLREGLTFLHPGPSLGENDPRT